MHRGPGIKQLRDRMQPSHPHSYRHKSTVGIVPQSLNLNTCPLLEGSLLAERLVHRLGGTVQSTIQQVTPHSSGAHLGYRSIIKQLHLAIWSLSLYNNFSLCLVSLTAAFTLSGDTKDRQISVALVGQLYGLMKFKCKPAFSLD